MNDDLVPYVVPDIESFEERKRRDFEEARRQAEIESDPELLLKANVKSAVRTLIEVMEGSFNDRMRLEAAKTLIQLARANKDEEIVEVEDINVTEIQQQILDILAKRNQSS